MNSNIDQNFLVDGDVRININYVINFFIFKICNFLFLKFVIFFLMNLFYFEIISII